MSEFIFSLCETCNKEACKNHEAIIYKRSADNEDDICTGYVPLLKDCPFCDLTPKKVELVYTENGAYVMCYNCLCRGPPAPKGDESWAIKIWNEKERALNKNDELKPCAHCGHEVEWKYDKYLEINQDNPDPFGKIYCINCGMQTGDLHTYNEAKLVWNKRYCTVLDEISNEPVCLPIIPTHALKRELESRGESGELPEWAKETIEKEMSRLWEEYAKTGIVRLDACARKLEWVLTLRGSG